MQTAVEWFFNELQRMQYFIGNDMLEAYKEAKEMEKQQIIDAYNKSFVNRYYPYKTAEWYVNETYGSKGSDETKIEKIPINLTSTQLIELAEIGTEFIYEGANGDTRLSSGGIIKIIQKYNKMTSSQTEISDVSKGSDEKIISQAHTNITRIKGKEYAPTSNEIQTEIEKSENPINLYDLLKKVADFWNRSEIPKHIFKQYLSEHNLDEIITSSQTEISDEISKIEKALYNAWSDYEYQNGNLYSTTFRDGWLMAIDWYKKQLKSRQ